MIVDIFYAGETTGIGGTGTASALAVGQNSSIILAKVNGTTTASAGAGNSRSGTKENPPSRQIHSKSNQAPLTASASSSSAGMCYVPWHYPSAVSLLIPSDRRQVVAFNFLPLHLP